MSCPAWPPIQVPLSVGRAAPPSCLPEAEAASAQPHRSLSEASCIELAWAAACSHHAWEVARPVVPWEAEVHLHCASVAWVACQPPCPPRGGCLQSGDPRWPAGWDPLPCNQQAPDPLASKYRKLQWRLFLASKFSGFKSHINPTSCHGGFFWQVISAGYFGTFSWRVFMASKSSRF